jgi:hypothetical protein
VYRRTDGTQTTKRGFVSERVSGGLRGDDRRLASAPASWPLFWRMTGAISVQGSFLAE